MPTRKRPIGQEVTAAVAGAAVTALVGKLPTFNEVLAALKPDDRKRATRHIDKQPHPDHLAALRQYEQDCAAAGARGEILPDVPPILANPPYLRRAWVEIDGQHHADCHPDVPYRPDDPVCDPDFWDVVAGALHVPREAAQAQCREHLKTLEPTP